MGTGFSHKKAFLRHLRRFENLDLRPLKTCADPSYRGTPYRVNLANFRKMKSEPLGGIKKYLTQKCFQLDNQVLNRLV